MNENKSLLIGWCFCLVIWVVLAGVLVNGVIEIITIYQRQHQNQ